MILRTSLLGAAAAVALVPAALAERGADGHVGIIYWQAPSILNPYLSAGTKDTDAASLVLEPLARADQDGHMVAMLAEEIPTVENDGVAADLTSITWRLKPGLVWSDGTPVTSADVKFTADYCMDPQGGCTALAKFQDIDRIDTPDARTIVLHFKAPKPNPYQAFASGLTPVLQQAQFRDCTGTHAPECTAANFGPIGTGAFAVTEFRPNDVAQFEANPHYRDPAKPAFATLTLKGGGDAVGAARAVLQTGEYDFAANLQLAPDVLETMETGGTGKAVFGFGSLVERIEVNLTDPAPDLPPEQRSTRKHPHPVLSDARVRRALSLAIDRALLTEIGYGAAGVPTCNLVPAPAIYNSDNTGCLTQDIEGAKALLEEAGWKVGAGGIREKDGRKLSLLFQSSTNAVRQDFQALIKQWWSEIGVETELRNVNASVFFGSDPGSPDTLQKFYADVEMYANNFDGTDPEAYLAYRTCGKEPRPATQWQGSNITRFCDPEYDALVAELSRTGEIAKRAEIIKRLNDMLTKDADVVLPLVLRGRMVGVSNTLGGYVLNPWDTVIWNAADWYRIK